jgi:peroxiredoxin Q/BCP
VTPKTARSKPTTSATTVKAVTKHPSAKRPARRLPAGVSTVARRGGATTGRRRRWVVPVTVLVAVLVVAGLYGIYRAASSAGSGSAGQYPFVVGQPGPGATAPDFSLTSTTGGTQTGTQSLAALRGKTVLLYFQEGLSCQPCFDQLADLQHNAKTVRAAGIDQVLSITTDPLNLLAQKSRDMHLSIPVLSDPDLAVSGRYHANQYGMMGTSRDGHTFILVGADGRTRWRADYGGAPKYTMFVPTADLLADLHDRKTS